MVNGGVVSPAVSSSKTYLVTAPALNATVTATAISIDRLSVVYTINVFHLSQSLSPAASILANTAVSGFFAV